MMRRADRAWSASIPVHTNTGARVGILRRVRMLLFAVLIVAVFMRGAALAADVDALVIRGSDALYSGELQEAEALFRQVVEAGRGGEFALNQLGVAVARQGRFAEAAEAFRRVLELNPQNIFARLWQGVLALEAGDGVAAEQAFVQVLERDAQNGSALYLLGVVYAAEHDSKRALQYFRQAGEAAQLRGGDAETQYRLGLAYRGLGMDASAELAFERAVDARPGYAFALTALGWLRYNRGDRAGAEEAWRRAAEGSGPAAEDARSSMASVLAAEAMRAAAAGDVAAERSLWEQVLMWEPENRAALHHLR